MTADNTTLTLGLIAWVRQSTWLIDQVLKPGRVADGTLVGVSCKPLSFVEAVASTNERGLHSMEDVSLLSVPLTADKHETAILSGDAIGIAGAEAPA